MASKRWNELTKTQQRALVAGSAVEVLLTAIALVDLARRPAGRVRGAKGWWVLAVFVQPVGPIAYLVYGRAR
ncbi:MAG: PLD nuclease N-terminal domain-containing protein [Actinomycetes bacterium]